MPRALTLVIVVSPRFDATAVAAMLDVAERVEVPHILASPHGGAMTARQGLVADTTEVDALRTVDVVALALGDPTDGARAPLAKHLRYWTRQERPMLDLAASDLSGAAAGDALLQLLGEALGEDLTTPDTSDAQLAAAPNALRRAVAILRDHQTESLPVPILAREVGVSQRQLERLFSAHLGRTPNQYHRRLRLDHARELLTTTPTPIAQVSAACGFASPVHFSRAYKAEFGLSPQQDRVATRRARLERG